MDIRGNVDPGRGSTIRAIILGLLMPAVLVGVSLVVAAGGESATTPSADDEASKMLVVGRGNGPQELDIFVQAPGESPVDITADAGSDHSPAWSPDKSRIAFASDRAEPGNTDIYVMEADGTNVQRITTDPQLDTTPAWAPDGSAIAFSRTDDKGRSDLWVVDLVDSRETRLTVDGAAKDFASWAPDGSSILFARNDSGDCDIVLIPAAGGAEVLLTSGPDFDWDPEWSPDGSSIIFLRDRDLDGSGDLWVMDAKGENATVIAETKDDERLPTWSPDGTQVAYVVFGYEGDPGVFVIPVSGGEGTRVASGTAVDW